MDKLSQLTKTGILISIFIALFCCCSKLFPDEKLTLPRQEYTGDELRTDGYYYRLYYTNNNMNTYILYFFYNNGTILYLGTKTDVELENLKNSIKTLTTDKTSYGIYNIDNTVIKFEKWYPGDIGKGLPVYIREGIILNDTTFHITASYKPDGSERREKDEIYHFKQFSPKPDSTNNFIK